MGLRVSVVFILAVSVLVPDADSVIKQNYGGNLKVAEDLLERVNSHQLVVSQDNDLKPVYPIPLVLEGSTAVFDLGPLNPDQRSEIEEGVHSLGDPSSPCHWILDYPYPGHEHSTTISVEKNQLIVHCAQAEDLPAILSSSCLVPGSLRFLSPFKQTQYGIEANPNCLAGRPFLDSVSAVVVDSTNPYLSFKLSDVDVFSIPEDRFQQVANDPQVRILEGLQYYLFFRTSRMTPEQILQVTGNIDLKAAAGAVLNDHIKVMFAAAGDAAPKVTLPAGISFSYPSEFPYQLIGERLLMQMKEAGIPVEKRSAGNAAALEMEYVPVLEGDLDVFRYHLLKDQFKIRSNRPWYEEWDQLESSGTIVPLLIHISRIAARENIQEFRVKPDGFPDFANCWIWHQP